MHKSTLTILILGIATLCNAQTLPQTKFFSSPYLENEVPPEKAKYAQTITQNGDSTVTTTIKNLKKDQIISSETYKGKEPFGVWTYQIGKDADTLDFNFPLIYSKEKCPDSAISVLISDYFFNVDSLGYKAPVFTTGETSVYPYITRHLYYPNKAKENNIQGKVFVTFTMAKEGPLENIVIIKGANTMLDKEAVRVLRAMKLVTPPMLNGHPQSVCVTMPIVFKLM